MRFYWLEYHPPPLPPNHTSVKKSTGRFGALQVRKVLSSVLMNREKKLERTLGKSNHI